MSMRHAAAVALGLGAAAAVFAQDQAGRPFQAEVNYVRVDMFATSDGKVVTDLAQEDIEVLEDGVVQKVEHFEHVLVAGPRPQTTRREPSTVEEMRRASRDPRARVLVLFLDPRFVDLDASMKIRRPLINALNSLIGGDDLIAVMTPSMPARGITFTRRTESIEQLLASHWGEKGWLGSRDPVEFQYDACYVGPGTKGIAEEMVARRREVQTLDALQELTDHLRVLREERKAVIVVSDGWPLYGPDQALARALVDPDTGAQTQMPVPRIGRDPRTGRPTTDASPPTVFSNDGSSTLNRAKCEDDRLTLSELRNRDRFITMMHAANRANVSFYPVDPGRLFSPQPSLNPNWSLETMAAVTDGLTIAQPGAMDVGLRRLVDDLSSYYLLGYYSNAKPDGKFHKIAVRVKRPGIQVRARSGYLAATAADAATPMTRVTSVDSTESQMLTQALSSLATFSRELPLRVQAAAAWSAAGAAVIRAVAEVPRSTAVGDDWSKGGTVEATLLNGRGQTVATTRASLEPGTFAVPIALASTSPLPADDYRLQIRVRGVSALGSTETVPLTLHAAPIGTGAIFIRRGASTGNREFVTADLRFRRTERLIVEVPAAFGSDASARVLGRTGSALSVPVTATVREDAEGTRWRRVEVVLAPLAAGDYIVEISGASDRTLASFRVVP
jgi:VWFA-related protein